MDCQLDLSSGPQVSCVITRRRIRFRAGKLLFETSIDEDVDVMIEAPYDILLPRARAPFGDEPEKWRRSFEELVRDGTIA